MYVPLLFDKMSVVYDYANRLADTDVEFHKKLRCSLDFIEEWLTKCGFDNVCLAFNGGKDCTVLLHLISEVAAELCKPANATRLCVFYAKPRSTFEEVESFIGQCEKRYRVQLLPYNKAIRESLTEFKSQYPEKKYVFMGTRSTDPGHSVRAKVAKTDPDWPEFTLLKPIVDWSYRDVWRYLRDLIIPYCQLYDKGYTSLGSKDKSAPNPYLMIKNENGQVTYKAAYLLDDVTKERYGRK